MTSDRLLLAALGLAALSLAGCQSTARALGLAPVPPDEFRVVSKAPLVIPPEYALRPPAPGEPRPQDLEPTEAARAALNGRINAATRSQGEALLVQRAGGANIDPQVRYVIDDEAGDIAHKDESFAQRVLNWRPGSGAAAAQAAATPAPVNSLAEEVRLRALTGGRTIIIERQQSIGLKLPGL